MGRFLPRFGQKQNRRGLYARRRQSLFYLIFRGTSTFLSCKEDIENSTDLSVARRFGGKRNKSLGMFLLTPLKVLRHGADVIVKSSSIFLSYAPHFFNNGIRYHNPGSISSSGVQITGHAYPADSTRATIRLRCTAFARCLQFHVNR